MSRIVLGVGGGVAAYKAALLLRALTEAGHDVRVVPTPGALHFVGAATFEALSGNPVTTDVWSDVPEVAHVRIGQRADLVVVAPATADLLARQTPSAGTWSGSTCCPPNSCSSARRWLAPRRSEEHTSE